MKSILNLDQINGILRIIVPGLCTWLAAKGFNWLGDEGVQAEAAAVAIAVVAMIWSYITHTPENTLKRAAKLDPDIKIVVPDDLMTRHPSVKELVLDTSIPQVTANKT